MMDPTPDHALQPRRWGRFVMNAVVAVAATIGVAYFCLFQAQLLGMGSLGFGLFLNLMLMAYFALLVGVFNPPLQAAYFQPRRWERRGHVYRWLGVRRFVVLLRLVGSERHRRAVAPIRNDVAALQRFARRTRVSEASHALAGGVVLGVTLYVAVSDGVHATGWLLLFNTLLNGYPVLLQRYNRIRLDRVLRWAAARAA